MIEVYANTKPCPFCGTHAPIAELDSSQGNKWGSIVCGCCGAKGPDVRTDYTPDGPWVEDAIETWNERK